MFDHLGRSEGNPALAVFQKYLTGHPKGAAGAWMFNGALQILNSGIVPGNRNADNIDKVLEEFEYLLFPSKSIKTDGVKAISVTSFGFGQKGAMAIAINSDYLFGILSRDEYETYAAKFNERHNKAYSHFHNSFINNSLFKVKDHAPYSDELQNPVYLDPLVRVSQTKKGGLEYASKDVQNSVSFVSKSSKDTSKILSGLVSGVEAKNIGVDVELISSINVENETFIERNFTAAEIKYCQSAPSPQSSFAGTWSAKEAVFKALGVPSKGAGAQLKDIEILRDSNGAPQVELHGEAKKSAPSASVKVSISHDDFQSVAVAILN
jgi:fatty acid synthase subunit alpha